MPPWCMQADGIGKRVATFIYLTMIYFTAYYSKGKTNMRITASRPREIRER